MRRRRNRWITVMNCLECARMHRDTVAVALCPRCMAGLCLAHVESEALNEGAGGMNLSCQHRTWRRPRVGMDDFSSKKQ